MKKFLRNVLILILLCAAPLVVEVLVYFAIRGGVDFTFTENTLFWGVYGLMVLVGLALTIFRFFSVWEGKRVLKVNDGLEESRWLTMDDVLKNESLTLTTLKKMKSARGIPVYARAKGKDDLDIILAQPTHVLVIGTTGSGKTSGFLEPEIDILSRQVEKPSMIIGDPKGELYSHRSAALMAQGYRVIKIDISEPYKSIRWNPFGGCIRATDEINACDLPDGDKRKVYIQERKDKIFDDMKDIIESICPVESKTDPGWEKAARDFILAIALCMQNCYAKGDIPATSFNLANLHHNVLEYATPSGIEKLQEYFSSTVAPLQARGLAQTVVVAEGRTLTSYLSEINKYMTWLVDNGICALTAEDEIVTSSLDEEPTALFLIIPEEKETRYKLVTLFVTQLYKELLAKAKANVVNGATKKQELLRTTYFLLDEFGNLPKIPLVDKIITAGRSRKIFLQAVIQDYAQMDAKYGKEMAAMIKSNCNVKVFIGSTDPTTLKEYSELCGKEKVKNVTYGGRQSDAMHVNLSATERPLIHPTELGRLNDPPRVMGNAIVLAFGKYPLRAKFAPIFTTAAYSTPGVCDETEITRFFDAADCHADVFKKPVVAERPDTGDHQQSADDEGGQLYIEEEMESRRKARMEEVPEEHVDDVDSPLTELRILYAEIDERLAKFEELIPAESYYELQRSDFAAKISLLGELAQSAREQGNRILALDLQKTAAILQAQYGERIESAHEKGETL